MPQSWEPQPGRSFAVAPGPVSLKAGAEGSAMRVLVTRPEPEACRTVRRLEAMGHDAVRLPLFKARIMAGPAALPPAATIDGLIATSARAFAIFGPEPAPPDYLCLPVYAVGPATEQAARRAGFSTIERGYRTARDLCDVLVGLHGGSRMGSPGPDATEMAESGTGKTDMVPRLLFLAGSPRKPTIEAELAASGMRPELLECYQMDEISYSTDYIFLKLLSPPPDVVLLYSAMAAKRFSDLMTAKNLDNLVVSAWFACLSPEISAGLPDAWQARVVTASHPDEESLLASLAALG